MRRHKVSMAVAAVLLLGFASPGFAQAKGPGSKLAQETVQLLGTQEMMLVTAVRQKETRGGKEDFDRFIMQPLEAMAGRWRALSREERLDRIHCITALQEFQNHASDSFKAGRIGPPNSLYKESLAVCKKA